MVPPFRWGPRATVNNAEKQEPAVIFPCDTLLGGNRTGWVILGVVSGKRSTCGEGTSAAARLAVFLRREIVRLNWLAEVRSFVLKNCRGFKDTEIDRAGCQSAGNTMSELEGRLLQIAPSVELASDNDSVFR